jgi:AraC-like DNA-binding protein
MNIDKLINRTLEKAVEVSGAAGGCLYINSSSGGTELKSRTGSIEPPAGMPVIAEMAIKESWTELTEKQGENGADINIMIPVILEGKTQGLCCLYRTGGSFGKREKILAKCFIRQAAGAMENAFLYQRMINRNAVLHQHSVTVNIEEKIKKAISYISENYHSDISREGLASSINMHPDSFGRFFKIYTGKKINEFINELRVIEAAGKIRNSDDNIIDIAFSAGFESLPTFNRAFMKLMKVTPTKYREK